MATVATVPALALPNKSLQLVFTADANGNYVKVWCTSAPRGSKLRKELDDKQSERVIVITESDITKRPQFTFDVGGQYVLEIEEFQKGAESYGGRYSGDPDGHRTETRNSKTTTTLAVATLLETELGVAPDKATLQLYVLDDEIVTTTVSANGLLTPCIIRPSSDRARAAADTTTVIVALGNLEGLAANALGDLGDFVTDFIDKFNGHAYDPGYHLGTQDNLNTINVAFRDPGNLPSLQRSLSECSKHFSNHVQNIDPASSTPGPASSDFHQSGGDIVTDWANIPVAPGGATIGACQIQAADIHRCYTAHLANDTVHISPDVDWGLDPLAPLGVLHSAFLAQIAALAPSTPANEHSGKTVLVSSGGFKEP